MNSASSLPSPRAWRSRRAIGIGKSPTLIDQHPTTTIRVDRTRQTPTARGSRRTENQAGRIARRGSEAVRRRPDRSRVGLVRRVGDDGHSCAIRARRTRSTNTGPPIAAVMMPTWTSPGRAMTRPDGVAGQQQRPARRAADAGHQPALVGPEPHAHHVRARRDRRTRSGPHAATAAPHSSVIASAGDDSGRVRPWCRANGPPPRRAPARSAGGRHRWRGPARRR